MGAPLCLGENVRRANKFTKDASLEKYRIKEAYTCYNHSLFLTEKGKVLACGGNRYGELLLDRCDDDEVIFRPVETIIESGASFCIAGHLISAVFVGEEMHPNMPNRRLTM